MKLLTKELQKALFTWFNSYENDSAESYKDREKAMNEFVKILKEIIRNEIKEMK